VGKLYLNDPYYSILILIAVSFVYIFFLGRSFQEKWGWRGYVLDKLQARWSAFVSSVVLGVLWGAWHLPLFFIARKIQSQTPIWGFIILILCGSIFSLRYTTIRVAASWPLYFSTQ